MAVSNQSNSQGVYRGIEICLENCGYGGWSNEPYQFDIAPILIAGGKANEVGPHSGTKVYYAESLDGARRRIDEIFTKYGVAGLHKAEA